MTKHESTPEPQVPPADAPPDNGREQAASDELQAWRERAEAAEKARDEYLDLAKRTRADFENYQKRFSRDLAEERRYAQRPLAADLLPVLDNLERAVAAAEQTGQAESLVQGVKMAHAQLLDVLRRHGVTRIDALGQPFDPNRHEAVMQQPSAEHPPMTVVQVLEPGYTLHDRVLRPARVIVATAPAGT
jgi:molecular chaperone GrpE